MFGISGKGRIADWGINIMFNLGEWDISRNYFSRYEIQLLDKKETWITLCIPVF